MTKFTESGLTLNFGYGSAPLGAQLDKQSIVLPDTPVMEDIAKSIIILSIHGILSTEETAAAQRKLFDKVLKLCKEYGRL